MKFSTAAISTLLLASSASAFVVTTPTKSSSSPSSSALHAVEVQDAPPPMAPLTAWGDKIPDIVQLQKEMRAQQLPEFAPEVSALQDCGLTAGDLDGQLQYVKANADRFKQMMEQNGAVVFRDWDLMKTQEGFQSFYQALGMKVCLDPLHSVSARPTVDGQKNSPVYEAVNKESRKNFFIGMHNEFVGTRAPRAAAFVCLKAAETGGEFLIADGRRMFCDLETSLVEELYQRQIRYSVMELPFFGWIDNLPGMLQEPVKGAVKGLAETAINAKVDFDVQLLWQGEDDAHDSAYDNVRKLQARAPKQPPIVLHPVTGEPTWFCNVHSHSSQLRKSREATYGAERFEDGASQINKSDMFFGDDGELTVGQLEHLDAVTMKNVRFVKMREGDVVLLDNYKTMHGRNVFDGTRKHGVAWFEGWEGQDQMTTYQPAQKPFFVEN